jgi:hypothetical protein
MAQLITAPKIDPPSPVRTNRPPRARSPIVAEPQSFTSITPQVWYDDPTTLQEKYQAVLGAGVAAVAVWTSDGVNYGEGTIAEAMWAALPPPTRTPPAAGASMQAQPRAQAEAVDDAQSKEVRQEAVRQEKAQETHAQQAHAQQSHARDTCQSNVCVGPKGSSNRPSDRGRVDAEALPGSYPVGAGMSYTAVNMVPPVPVDFLPSQNTIYYYFNLIPPNLPGVGHFNQVW